MSTKSLCRAVFPDGGEIDFDVKCSESISARFEEVTGKELSSETIDELIELGYKCLFLGYK